MKQINTINFFFLIPLISLLAQLPLFAQRATHRFGTSISLQATEHNSASGFTQRYVLTDTVGVIQYAVVTLPFTNIAIGQYKAYAVNYDGSQTAPQLVVGTNITAIGGACVAISNALAVGVMDCNNTTGTINPTIAGQTTGSAFTQKYLLTDSIGTILQIANTPQYVNLINGIYNVYALNYETITGITGLTVGQNINTVMGACISVSSPLGYVVCRPPVEIADNGLDDDNDGKIDCEDSDLPPCNCTTASSIVYNPPTTNPSVNHTRRYVLTTDNGILTKVSTTPLFSDCADGQYRVYTVWYIPSTYTPPLSIGSTIATVVGTNVSISLPKLEKVCAPTTQFDTRILEKMYDCVRKKLIIQVQVRANPQTGSFLMGDANYRFDYNSTQLRNPQIVSQEHFSNIAPASDVNYLQQSLLGSSEGVTIGTVSLNTIYGGGGVAARTVDSVWQTVACLQFDKQDSATCYAFRWHNAIENPSTGMTGVILKGGGDYDLYQVVSSGYFGNLQSCSPSVPCCPTLGLTVLLEGAYNTTTGLMTTTLNQRGLLPGQTPIGQFAIPTPIGQPFYTNPWNYAGTEAISSYPPTVVDWVLVSLRTDSTTATSTVLQKAGLLHNDGHISFIDSCWNLTDGQKYFILVEHRNHMGVLSNTPFTAQSRILFDFTTNDSYSRTNPPTTGQKQIGSKWVMLTADSKKNTQVTNYDINFYDHQLWKIELGIFDQYRYSDFNLDADTNFLDSNMWKKNSGRYSGVPH